MSGTPPLPAAFLGAPIAHRGLHDRIAGRPENSLAAMAAAADAGYGVELDLHPSADGVAMVFHDPTLDRMTAAKGRVDARTADELATVALAGTGQTIPRLSDVLALIGGRVPVLIELKDQSGVVSEAPPVLEQAAADALAGYTGPAAVMSFNPAMVSALARLAPDVPRGLVTEDYDGPDFRTVPAPAKEALHAEPDLDAIGASFVSHEHSDLDRRWLARLRARGVPVLCWTIRSPAEEAQARRHADNVTFEGYIPNRDGL